MTHNYPPGVRKKLENGFEGLRSVTLSQIEVAYLDIIIEFDGNCAQVWGRVFQGAFESSDEKTKRHAVLKRLDKLGIIHIRNVTTGKKFDFLHELKDYLDKTYPGHSKNFHMYSDSILSLKLDTEWGNMDGVGTEFLCNYKSNQIVILHPDKQYQIRLQKGSDGWSLNITSG